MTTSRPVNAPCIFPFTINNTLYHECVLDIDGAWCPTELDYDGTPSYMMDYVNGREKWGFCGQECPIPIPPGILRISSKGYLC